MKHNSLEDISKDIPNAEISQYDLSIRLIDQHSKLTFKDLTNDLLVYWTLGDILTSKHTFLFSDQWSIFLHAFKRFEEEHVSDKSLIHYSFIIKLARYWEEHLYEINSEVMKGEWPDEIEIFQFEKWIEKISIDKQWNYSLNILRFEQDKKGKMIIR